MANNKSGNSSRNRSNSQGNRGGKFLGKEEPEQARTLAQKFLSFFGFGKPPAPAPKKKSGGKKPVTQHPVSSERLFIGNLAYAVKEDDLRDLFSEIGEVASAEVVINRQTKRSKGFGFVTMGSVADAEKAAKELDGREVSGRQISVSGAKSDGKKDGQTSRKEGGRPPRKRTEGGKPGGRRNEGRERNDQRSGGRDGGKGRDRGPKGRGKKTSSHPTVVPMPIEEVSSPHLSLDNLADDFGQSELDHLFAGVAHVAKSEIDGGKAKIEMASVEEAQKAVKLLHGKDFMGKTLSLSSSEDSDS